MKKKLTTLKGSISRLIASFICVLLVIGLFPSTVFAAACSAEIKFKVIPVYLDASMYLGYDVDYGNARIGTLPCTYNTDHASNANHQIQVKGFHPDVIKLQVREGYEWAGWAKYTIDLQDVKNPPFATYYDWSPATTSVNGTGTHYIYMIYHQEAPSIPTAPNSNTVKKLLDDGAVKVDCINNNVVHEDAMYGLFPDSYTIGDVEVDETSGYTCDITVQPDPYVQAYNGVHGDHTLDPDSQTSETITLTWDTDSNSWSKPDTGIPVIFTVKCTITPPAKPTITGFTKERLTSIPDDIIWVDGFNTNDINTDASVVIPNGGSVTLLYQLTVTGDAGANFVVTDEGATLVGSNCDAVQSGSSITGTIPADGTAKVYVTKTFGAGDIVDDQLINTADVKPGENTDLDDSVDDAEVSTPAKGESPTKPTAPDEDDLPTLLGDGVVKVDCEASSVSHVNKTYGLIQSSYTPGTVTSDGDTGYIYTLTIDSEEYVAQYNDDVGAAHTLHTDNQTAEIILTWNAETDEWELATNLPIIFAVTE